MMMGPTKLVIDVYRPNVDNVHLDAIIAKVFKYSNYPAKSLEENNFTGWVVRNLWTQKALGALLYSTYPFNPPMEKFPGSTQVWYYVDYVFIDHSIQGQGWSTKLFETFHRSIVDVPDSGGTAWLKVEMRHESDRDQEDRLLGMYSRRGYTLTGPSSYGTSWTMIRYPTWTVRREVDKERIQKWRKVGYSKLITTNRCIVCKRCDEDLFLCGQCMTAVYCSPECQHEDWRASHKKKCRSDPMKELTRFGV